MNKQTVDSILCNFEKKNILTRNDYTFVEYVNELFEFQKEVAKLVFKQDDVSDIRINEVIAKCESTAREKNLKQNIEVRDGIRALRLIEKEISIAMAGKKGENRVAYTFKLVRRNDVSFYRNVYLQDESEDTEIDAVVLTKNGAIVIEIKNAKEDITINSEGRLLYGNSSCYHDNSIGEKMEKKRRLLKKRIESEFKERGVEKDIVVDSILVFAPPSGVRIKVHDQFRQEKYCFKGSLPYRIDAFISEVAYTDEEYEALNQILLNISKEQKRFDIKFDPAVIKNNFAKAYVALFDEEEPYIEKGIDFEEVKTMDKDSTKKKADHKEFNYKLPLAVVAIFTSAFALPALPLVSAGAIGAKVSSCIRNYGSKLPI